MLESDLILRTDPASGEWFWVGSEAPPELDAGRCRLRTPISVYFRALDIDDINGENPCETGVAPVRRLIGARELIGIGFHAFERL